MAAYKFAVLDAENSVFMQSIVEIDSARAVWAQVVALAEMLGDIRAQIRVSNSEDELVIVTGVLAARHASGADRERAAAA